jgi:hypothetical protein
MRITRKNNHAEKWLEKHSSRCNCLSCVNCDGTRNFNRTYYVVCCTDGMMRDNRKNHIASGHYTGESLHNALVAYRNR